MNVRHKEQGTALKKSPRPTAPQQLLPLPELVQDIPAWATLAPMDTPHSKGTPDDSEYLGTAQHFLMSKELILGEAGTAPERGGSTPDGVGFRFD
ncbi:hypothetical protein B0H14DRAFT_3470804 [Mycena olivaceomarginata]|nr:hypothetical protein B0H14DRAFT_3470804 [Mycena olivaceomarginata]